MKESQVVLEWQQDAREEGRAEARQEAVREKLLRTLELRFAPVPDELRSQIAEEPNIPTLNRWFDLAVTAADRDTFRRGL